MKIYGKIIVVVLATCLFCAGNVAAEQKLNQDIQAKCAELIGECFSYDETERVNCFYSSATHPFCDGTELGKLSFARWAMSPRKEPGPSAPAFLGPQLVDGTCVANFDNEWFSKLTAKDYSAEQIAGLKKKIESCKKQEPFDLPRP